MEKKIFALVLVAFLLLSLPACKEESPNTHLDWISIPSSGTTGAMSDTGFYDKRNGVLTYIDFATGASVVLCQKPGCRHEHGLEGDARCDAQIDGSWMVFGNDRLYYIESYNTLCSRNAIGGELEELGMLAKELVKDRKSVSVSPLLVSNGYLYYEGTIMVSEQNGSGTSSTSAGSCIGRFNLAQRKDELLVVLEQERTSEKIEVIAARENGLFYLYQEGLSADRDWSKVPTKERSEALKTMPTYIKHLNIATGETTVLFTSTYSECKTVNAVENGKIFYSGNGISIYDLATGKVESIYTGDFSSSYYGKGYWKQTKWLDAKTAEIQIYDMNTGKTLPHEPVGTLGLINRSDHGMVMYYNNHSTIDGNFFVSYESLADGLRESDLKLLYTN